MASVRRTSLIPAAENFQDSILRVFINKIQTYNLEKSQLCQLLGIACNDITEYKSPTDDPMYQHIFWLAACRLAELQHFDEFHEMLDQKFEENMN